VRRQTCILAGVCRRINDARDDRHRAPMLACCHRQPSSPSRRLEPFWVDLGQRPRHPPDRRSLLNARLRLVGALSAIVRLIADPAYRAGGDQR
jgi:hypothetical protein